MEKALSNRGLSVNQASKTSGINYDTIWKHKRGEREVSPEMAILYEEKLSIPRSELRPDLWPPELMKRKSSRKTKSRKQNG